MDIEINRVDQQKYELNKYQPRKELILLDFLIVIIILPQRLMDHLQLLFDNRHPLILIIRRLLFVDGFFY